MPRYDMKCKNCGLEREVTCSVEDLHNQACPQCGEKMYVFFKSAPALSIWTPTYFEEIDFYAETKQDLKEHCRKNDINWWGE